MDSSNTNKLKEEDSTYPVWHPYTQMKTAGPPLEILRGEGAWLMAKDGRRILDLISSWWVNLHGHAHPDIASRIADQAAKLEQVIFAGFTHSPAIELARALCEILPGKPEKIFYSENGSTAVEVGLKMAFQYWYNIGKPRKKILAFRSAYHGDTFGAMSVSSRSVFTQPFFQQLFEVVFLPDPTEEQLELSINLIDEAGEDIAAFIYEPLVMGAAGMIAYTPAYLSALMQRVQSHQGLLIADEVMTGFGRLGTMFASEQMPIHPDMICLSKGLTGGFLPMGVTSARKRVYEAFHQDDRMKTFFHGHSYTANPLACTAALASLDCFKKENTLSRILQIELRHQAFVASLKAYDCVVSKRVKGSLLAITLTDGITREAQYLSDLGPVAYKWFMSRGLLLRPLGNVIYLLPPYCIKSSELDIAYEHIQEFLEILEKGDLEIFSVDPVFG
jgi:adenosylmethionine-8-amino-7-oxononanoate aminotransferase